MYLYLYLYVYSYIHTFIYALFVRRTHICSGNRFDADTSLAFPGTYGSFREFRNPFLILRKCLRV